MKTRLAAIGLAFSASTALAVVPEAVPELPVLNRGNAPGASTIVDLDPVTPTPKVIDGWIDDWTGSSTGFGGTTILSHGELIHQDHLFDAYGADDGGDAERAATLDGLEDLEPRTYRLEAMWQQDVPGQLGIPSPFTADENYGDAGFRPAADLVEVRLAADDDRLYVLARTTTMHSSSDTALLVLLDDGTDGPGGTVPFGSGLSTANAEHAVFLASTGSRVVRLSDGASTPIADVEIDPTGFTNAIEAAIPLSAIGTPTAVAVAAGLHDGSGGFASLGSGPNVANVAFRHDEPIRIWWEREQAFELATGSIDRWMTPVDLDALRVGKTQEYRPGPGYHDRIFVSGTLPAPNTAVVERSRDGLWQHYGVFLPAGWDAAAPSPLQWWLHWRGGKAHTAGMVIPHMFRDLGDEHGAIVVSPSARGTSSWYVSAGHVDFLEVRKDVHETFAIDESRIYVTGHSMGGFGSWLLSILYPDYFAAAMPVAGPVTQGAWTGLDFAGCENYNYDEYSFCYVETDSSHARDQHHRKLLENLRNTPVAVYQGMIDELVPTSGVTRQIERLVELGYRHRYYLFPTYEHYTHPIVDEWADGGRYMHSFIRDADPECVTYVRDMAFEQAVEQVRCEDVNGDFDPTKCPSPLDFDFDSAFWMSGLSVKPVDGEIGIGRPHETAGPANVGVARFHGCSAAIPPSSLTTLPEVGGPASLGQTGPFVMTGLQWLDLPGGGGNTANVFEADVEGATAVTLDLVRMGLSFDETVQGEVATDTELELTMAGGWTEPIPVYVEPPGGPFTCTVENPIDGSIALTLEPGFFIVLAGPPDASCP